MRRHDLFFLCERYTSNSGVYIEERENSRVTLVSRYRIICSRDEILDMKEVGVKSFITKSSVS